MPSNVAVLYAIYAYPELNTRKKRCAIGAAVCFLSGKNYAVLNVKQPLMRRFDSAMALRMTATARKILAASLFALVLAVAMAGAPAAYAEPMKCSGEEKVCLTNCRKAARIAVSVCATGCGSRLSYCLKSGCWDNGTQKYCGLTKS